MIKGKVQTVCGPVDPATLGRTLTHEHFSLVFDVAFTPPPPADAAKTTLPLTINNLGWIRQNPYSHRDNISLNTPDSWSAVQDDVMDFKSLGGGCIVENTTHGIARNTNLINTISRKTEVQVVAGTGYYVNNSQDVKTLGIKVEEMSDVITKELVEGCLDFPSVKCGVIGEVGCSWPLTDFERKSISAAGEVQASLGCPVTFHPGRHPDAPQEILRVYQEAGGRASKAVMSHLDRTIHVLEDLTEFASLGSFCEYDLFGIETSHYQLDDKVDMPSDAQRIARIKHLIDEGYGEKILVAHDIHTKHRLSAYGGHGFGHILRNIVPKMRTRGFTQEMIDKILINNPATWLTI